MFTENASDGPRFSEPFAGRLRPRVLAGVHACIAAIHGLCASYFVFAGLVFRRARTCYTVYKLEDYNVTLPKRYYGVIAIVHFVLAACHGYFFSNGLKCFLWRSIRPDAPTAVWFPAPRIWRRLTKKIQTLARYRAYIKLNKWVRLVYKSLFSRRGMFGVEYRYFNQVFLFRETIQSILQTYQGYQMSIVVRRRVLNGFFVGVLVLNCWLTSILLHSVKSEGTRRLLCRLGDTVLNFFSSVGMPVVIALSYIPYYVPALVDLDPNQWDDTMWVINIVNESPHVLFGSWLDAFSRLLFAIGLLSSLRNVDNMMDSKTSKRASGSKRTSVTSVSVAPSRSRKSARWVLIPSGASWKMSSLVKFGHGFLCVVGLIVLIAHLHSELRTPPPSYCGLGIWPWFATQPTCTTVDFNCCTDRQLTGQATQLDKFLASFQASALRELTIRHCTHIEFGPRLQTFPNLQSLGIYNSTVLRWDSDAELADAAHPLLSFAYFVRTQFANGTLPMGFAASTFPRMVNRLQFLLTNLATIPFDIHDRWPPGIDFSLDMSELKEVPLTLTKAHMSWVSLSFNHISTVPPELITAPSLVGLWLDGNPLFELPVEIKGVDITLSTLFVHFTSLSSLPAWTDEMNKLSSFINIFAGGTPLCERIQAGAITASSVNCGTKGMNASTFRLEIEVLEDQMW